MENISSYLDKFKEDQAITDVTYRNQRDELVAHFVRGINELRVGTKFKPITPKMVAIRINKNPFLARNDSEVYNLLKHCQNKKNYAKFFWVTNESKKTDTPATTQT